jgi:oligosaccharide translocation protein RFT1
MYMQSVFKLLLTQGDALIMSFLSSLSDQGAFALASNYGGLLARLVFQPVEESSRNLFGRLLAPESSTEGTTDNTPTPSTTNLNQAKVTTTSPKATNIHTALTHLSTTLHFYLLFSRPLVALIPPILPTLIPFALSSQWRTPSTITLLQIYCYYIPLMALNGVLDAFVTSVATPSQLRAQSLWMAVFTGVYGLAAWVMMKMWGWGSVGLVGANIVNTAARIVWSATFIRRWVGVREGEMGEKGMWKEIVKAVVANAGCVLVSLLLRNEKIGGTSSSAIDAKTGNVNVQFLGLWTASAVLLGTTM